MRVKGTLDPNTLFSELYLNCSFCKFIRALCVQMASAAKPAAAKPLAAKPATAPVKKETKPKPQAVQVSSAPAPADTLSCQHNRSWKQRQWTPTDTRIGLEVIELQRV